MDTTARDLFEKLKGQFKNLTLGKEDGTRTLVPSETSFFEFDYHNDESKLGSVVVSLVDDAVLKFTLQPTLWTMQIVNPKMAGMDF